ncbi:hypothetical protein LPW41_11640 [Microbacterium sp. JC 701]|uniref:hypothetical protein n=1 Tax=Microbacterium sp. JC 701 TaxID=2897389 RepID=UPI001E39BA12|nr:hypothetical protein [Microbacterium sp. JC 701]MCD2170349.1 hypothetical protein [Microbacterium sp. JC 701]
MGAGLGAPPSALFDPTGLQRITPPNPAVIPGTLFWWEPGTMASRTLVPANGDLIENQSGWAIDLLGEQARWLTYKSSLLTGAASRLQPNGEFRVTHGRGAATQAESITLENQRVRDHIDGNRSRRIGQVLAYNVTQKPEAYTPSVSQRVMGLVDATNYRAAIALSSDRTLLTGYPTGATRLYNKTGSTAGGRDIVITVHDGYTGAASSSPTLLGLNNGGAGAPGMSLDVLFAGMCDLTAANIGPVAWATLMLAHYNEVLATGGIYA